ncbi:hypothetical protein HYU72_02355 [Candidatus Berkelbacteria bacterium]|nr:hypothetical protein [Candidatus Berkelbacteria bacterium]
MKKYFIIGSIILVLALVLGLIAGLILRKKSAPQEKSPSSAQNAQVLLEKVPPEKIFFPRLFVNKKEIYYLGDQGVKLKKFALEDGKITILNKEDIFYANEIVWSPDFKQALIRRNDPNESSPWLYFNPLKQQGKNLHSNIKTASFLSEEKIVYYYEDQSKKTLNEAEADGSNWKEIATLKFSVDLILPLDAQKILIYSAPEEEFGKIFLFDLGTKKETLLIEGLVNSPFLSPNKDVLMYRRVKDEKAENFVLTIANKQENEISIKEEIKATGWSQDSSFAIIGIDNKDKGTIFKQLFLNNRKASDLNYKLINQVVRTEQIFIVSEKTFYFTSNDFLYKMRID